MSGEPDDAEPASREELERALRRTNVAIESLRDDLLRLAARVVALTGELERRGGVAEAAVDAAEPRALLQIRYADEGTPLRLELGRPVDKYGVEATAPPCAELLPICRARCCRMQFALSTQDLDEGIVRWDHAHPYRIRQRADGYCVHTDAALGCTIHAQRPAPCRAYDCRDDPRVWIDYAQRIPAPPEAIFETNLGPPPATEAEARARVDGRQTAIAIEALAVDRRRGDR
jgi:Fe-S-cluster containining protein